ncbi:MAG TPA: hypothetical protein VF453_02045 [Burkholderiaceae bacterium]
MTEKFNSALSEQLRSNVWKRTQEAVANMSPTEGAGLVADVTGIFDPTPASDTVGLALSLVQGDGVGAVASLVSMFPYVGDAVAKPFKIARRAPKVAEAIEAVLKGGDRLAGAGKAALKDAGLSLDQVAAARKQALQTVQKAMVEAKQKIANCETCKLKGADGSRAGVLHMPQNGKNGKWASGSQPSDGNGLFEFTQPKTLPDGRQVASVEYRDGAPVLDDFVLGQKHELWEVTGDVGKDETQLKAMMRQTDPAWRPPDPETYVLHHFEDGAVGYVPRVIHDKAIGGVAHTGGNSMLNTELF